MLNPGDLCYVSFLGLKAYAVFIEKDSMRPSWAVVVWLGNGFKSTIPCQRLVNVKKEYNIEK